MEKLYTKPANLYKFDEKRFLAGIMKASKRIVPHWMLINKRIAGSAQVGSRAFTSLLAYLYADRTALPPALIYQGGSEDLQDSWI